MLGNKDKAATSAEATAQNYNRQNESYQQCALRSSQNLKEQIGLLLFHLHSTLSQSQRKVGYQLFAILLVQYLTDQVEMQ